MVYVEHRAGYDVLPLGREERRRPCQTKRTTSNCLQNQRSGRCRGTPATSGWSRASRSGPTAAGCRSRPEAVFGYLMMAIYRILQNMPLSPEDISRLVAAYEVTLKALGLTDRNDPITELVARKIIEIGQTGIRDPQQISRLAVTD